MKNQHRKPKLRALLIQQLTEGTWRPKKLREVIVGKKPLRLRPAYLCVKHPGGVRLLLGIRCGRRNVFVLAERGGDFAFAHPHADFAVPATPHTYRVYCLGSGHEHVWPITGGFAKEVAEGPSVPRVESCVLLSRDEITHLGQNGVIREVLPFNVGKALARKSDRPKKKA